jgi:hypothetical protein
MNSFLAKPKTKGAWQVMWIGLLSLLVGPFFGFFMSVIRNVFDPVSYNPTTGLPVGLVGVFLGLGLSITTIVSFIKLYKSGERSLVLWAGFIPAVLVGVFWIFMIIGELLFPH